MRIRLGSLPESSDAPAAAEGWQPLSGGPSVRLGTWLAVLAGVILPCGPCVLLATVGLLVRPDPAAPPVALEPVPWGAIILTCLLYIPVHELLHAVWHPGLGLSDRTTLVIWPRKLNFGVYYEGCLSRARWLLMRAAPFIFLTLVPTALLAYGNSIAPESVGVLSWPVYNGLCVLFLVNALGSGGDAVAMLIVLRQVPRGGELCFRSGRAYWRARAALDPLAAG